MAPMSGTRDTAVPKIPPLNLHVIILGIQTHDKNQCDWSILTKAFTVPMLDLYKNFLIGKNYIELKLRKTGAFI